MKDELIVATVFFMSYRAAYLDEGAGALRVGGGAVRGTDLLAVAKKQGEELEKVFRIRYILVDFLAVTDFQVLPEDIYRLTEFNAQIRPYFARKPLVLILAEDKLAVAISQFWQTLTTKLDLKAHVADKQNALEWVKLWILEAGYPAESFPDLVEYLQGKQIAIEFMEE